MPSRRLPRPLRPTLLISSVLIFCTVASTGAAQEISEAAPTRLKIVNNEDEPQIEITEHQRTTPFKLVSRSRRSESNDKLVKLCQETVEVTSRRLLSTDVHTPWQMMHAMLGMRQDFALLHEGKQINGLDWVMEGQTYENEYWFEKTRFGGRAHPYSRPYAFEGHANQCVAILSMCGVDLDQTFGTASGPITMRDMIKHAQMSVSATDEPTWTLWALSRYLPPTAQWQNAKGEHWSIEKLVQSQTAKPMQGSPCGGTHGLFALAHARNVYLRQGKPLRGVWLQSEYKIRQYINTARMQTNSDGSLSSNYFRGRMYDPDFNKRMASVGHVLEFLMIALPQEELNSRWVRQAIETAAQDLMNNRKAYVKCSPLYHTVNALNIYLDRVNPRVPADMASAEETRTAEVQPEVTEDTKTARNGIPATSISQGRELPTAKEAMSSAEAAKETATTATPESKAPVAEEATSAEPAEAEPQKTQPATAPAATEEVKPTPATELPPADLEPGEPTAAPPEQEMLKVVPEEEPVAAEAAPLQEIPPVESAADNTAVEQPEQLKKVPLLPLTPTQQSAGKDDGKWAATRREHKGELNVPEEKTGGRKSGDATALPSVARPTVQATVPTLPIVDSSARHPQSSFESSQTQDSQTRIEPLLEVNAPPKQTAEVRPRLTVTAELPKQEQPVAKDSVPVLSVSQPRVVETPPTIVPMPAPDAKPASVPVPAQNSDTVPANINHEFLSSELNPAIWAAKFAAEDREIYQARADIVKAMHIKEGATIGDIGCGTGLFVNAFADAVGPGGRVFAIDISPRLVDYLDDRVTAEKLDNVSVVRNDEKSLQLLMHRVDIAFMCDTYHHLQYHKEMLASTFEALVPGGDLIIIDFDKTPGVSREWVMNNIRADKSTFTEEVQAAGFEFVEEVTIPGFTENYFLRFRRPEL
ncbi:MAG: methyltransferase domain-containing protein [Fuerstiella sp.]